MITQREHYCQTWMMEQILKQKQLTLGPLLGFLALLEVRPTIVCYRENHKMKAENSFRQSDKERKKFEFCPFLVLLPLWHSRLWRKW